MRRSAGPIVLAVAASVLHGAAAHANDCRLCTPGSGLAEEPRPTQSVEIQVQTSLNFDRLILLDGNGGSVRLSADGSSGTTGAVAGPTGRAMVGSVSIQGEPHRLVRVDLPSRIDLWGAGTGRISIDRLETDLPSAPRLDSAGRLNFRFGGELRISGDAEGDFRGDVPVTVEYL